MAHCRICKGHIDAELLAAIKQSPHPQCPHCFQPLHIVSVVKGRPATRGFAPRGLTVETRGDLRLFTLARGNSKRLVNGILLLLSSLYFFFFASGARALPMACISIIFAYYGIVSAFSREEIEVGDEEVVVRRFFFPFRRTRRFAKGELFSINVEREEVKSRSSKYILYNFEYERAEDYHQFIQGVRDGKLAKWLQHALNKELERRGFPQRAPALRRESSHS